MPNTYIPPKEKILKWSVPEPNTGCWLWIGGDCRGYGVTNDHNRTRRAPRASYEAFVGPIPAGMTIDHKCRVTLCVNPEHLEPVTIAENNHRMSAARTHCKNGHALVETEIKRGTHRTCRSCLKEASARYWRRKHPPCATPQAFGDVKCQ